MYDTNEYPMDKIDFNTPDKKYVNSLVIIGHDENGRSIAYATKHRANAVAKCAEIDGVIRMIYRIASVKMKDASSPKGYRMGKAYIAGPSFTK